MVFQAPEWVPKLDVSTIPDDIPLCDLILSEKHGRLPFAKSRNPFTCGLSGKTYSYDVVIDRVDALAAALSKEMGWQPNNGTEWDKCVGIFSLNTIDYNTLCWATHRLGGLVSPANAAYTADEVAYQMKDAGAKCIFTCLPLLKTTLEAAAKIGIPNNKIFLMDMPKELLGGAQPPKGFQTLDDLVVIGRRYQTVEAIKWQKGEGKKRVAFLCYSSGTSGAPKGVMISHHNVIANTIQICVMDAKSREIWETSPEDTYTENSLGLLPMSHIYGLVVICHGNIYRGDCVVVLPKFDLKMCLQTIQDHKLGGLYLVPPIIILFTNNYEALKKYDLSSVRSIFTGAAPLGEETAEELGKQWPSWVVRQGYGLTETSTVVCSTWVKDIWFGSCGSILPGAECRILSAEGKDVEAYDTPGELLVKSPSVVLGYLNNDKATKETFFEDQQGRWMRTGDEAVIRKNPKSGYEHIFIVDRIKVCICHCHFKTHNRILWTASD